MMTDLKQHIGIKVRAARSKRNLTQEQLGEMIDKTAESVSNIERGQVLPPLDTLCRIAQSLDVPLISFFEEAERTRTVARNRLNLEHRLRALGEGLTNKELELALALMETLQKQRS